ncbi:MAG: hypothetical protein BA867_07620 [Desulfobacterales bacterium S5133MH16]|nr:MAG: hypothetical protein BA867_07620 [Desulfobacterales bacterium S5133MH16]
MVKGCTLFESAQWFKSKNSVGFGQYSSIKINKADTIYCGLPFSLQAFDIEIMSRKSGLKKPVLTCQNNKLRSIDSDYIYH